MTGDVSRRGFCAWLAALLPVGVPASAAPTAVETEGWITKGDRTEIVATRSTVESQRGFGTSLCDDGERYACRTCDGDTFHLLVPVQSAEPSVGDSYRFEPTGEKNFCGDFKVRLLDAEPCSDSRAAAADETTTETTTEVADDAAESAPGTTTETTAETTTDTTSDTTTETTGDTTTETIGDTTTETTTDTTGDSSDTTTEASADATPEDLSGATGDSSDTTEQSSDPTERSSATTAEEPPETTS